MSIALICVAQMRRFAIAQRCSTSGAALLRHCAFILAASLLMADVASAQPADTLGRVVAASERLRFVSQVRTFSNGSVLVDDRSSGTLVLMDSTLRVVRTLLDATGYPRSGIGLIAAANDSTWVLSPDLYAMSLLDRDGSTIRVIAMPATGESVELIGLFGWPGIDQQGRLVYRGRLRPRAPPKTVDGLVTPPEFPDSAPLLRWDMRTRHVDTVTHLRVYQPKLVFTYDENKVPAVSFVINPLPIVDDWAISSTGIAVVFRGRTFSLEAWDGGKVPTRQTKIAFPWQALSDSAKASYIAAARKSNEGDNTGRRRYVDIDELPDYMPPFGTGIHVLADPLNQFWVATTTKTSVHAGGIVYRVIDDKGVVQRLIEVAKGERIVGFNGRYQVLVTHAVTGGVILQRRFVP